MSGVRFCVDCAHYQPVKDGDIYIPAARVEDGYCGLDDCVSPERWYVAGSAAERESCSMARDKYGKCGPSACYWEKRDE